MRKRYIVTCLLKSTRATTWTYPMTAKTLAKAARIAQSEIGERWEIVKIKRDK